MRISKLWATLTAAVLLYYPALGFAAVVQDFEHGLGDWKVDGPATVEKSLSGNSFLTVATKAAEHGRIFSPVVKLENQRLLALSFRYRSSIENSAQDHGAWVFVDFLDAGGKSVGHDGVVCPAAADWTAVDRKVAAPAEAVSVRVQFRLQNEAGRVDWDDLNLDPQNAPAVSVASGEKWKAVATFTLSSGSNALTSPAETLPGSGDSTVRQFVLPDRYTESPDLAYEIEMVVKPGWNPEAFDTLFALGDNVQGSWLPNSFVLSALNGKRLLARLNGSLADRCEIYRYNLDTAPQTPIHLRAFFTAQTLKFYYNDVLTGETALLHSFAWPKHRAFFVGRPPRGELVSFVLRVYQPVLNAHFADGMDSSYFEGPAAHPWSINFPDGNAQSVADTVEIHDLSGKTVARLSPQTVSTQQQHFTVPPLPYGWYSVTAALDGKDGATEKRRSFTVTRAVTRTTVEASPIGITTELPLRTHDFDPALVDGVFRRCAAAGVRWFRLWLRWDDIESEKGSFDWSGLDQAVDLARKHGLELYVCITGGANAFQADGAQRYNALHLMTPASFMPVDMDEWKNFLAAMADRYRHKVTYYQVWNEPDAKNGFYPFDPQSYVDVVKASAEALRKANPDVKIGIGGFAAAFDSTHLRQVSYKPTDSAWGAGAFYAANPGKYFDIVDGHFYSIGAPGQSWDGNLAGVRKAKAYLAEQGEGAKPLWNSETSMYSGPVGQKGGWANVPFISDEEQAVRLTQWEVQSLAAGVQKSFWYGFRGDIGIVNNDFSPKPVYAALANVAVLLQDAKYLGEEQLGENLRLYRFQRGTQELTAIWTTNGRTQVALSGVKLADAHLLDLMGNESVPASSLLEITDHPLFLLSTIRPTISPLASLELPAQSEGAPVVFSALLRNPSSAPAHFAYAASLTSGAPQAGSVDVPAGATQKIPFSLTGTGRHLRLELRVEGGLHKDITITRPIEYRPHLELKGSQPAEFNVDQGEQVAVGGPVYDLQNRLASPTNWKGAADLSANVRVWSEGGKLHFEARVRDDVVVPAGGDAVEWFFDLGKGKLPVQVIVGADGRISFINERTLDGFEVTVTRTPEGYVQSGSLDLPGTDSLGLEVAIDDADDTSGRKVQMSWTRNVPSPDRPQKFGVLTFAPSVL